MDVLTHVRHSLARLTLPLLAVILPVLLLASSLRTLKVLEEQQLVYLRSRAAALTGLLESLPQDLPDSAIADLAAESEPALVELKLISSGASEGQDPALLPLWEGRELFRSQVLRTGEGRIFRTEVPFHSAGEVRIARIDLDAAAADFLVVHARHNVWIASLSGLALVALALYAVWAARRTVRLELRQVQLEHLAQLGQMAATLAHEIRNPLGAVKGFIQLAAEQPGEPARDLLEPAVEEVRRIERLVNDLLLYGRPPEPHFGLVQWSEIQPKLLAHAERLRQGQDVRFQISADSLEWTTDPGLLEQVLVNLLRNAFEAAAGTPGAEVRLEARLGAGGDVIITVTDNGPGIPPEARARLFQPFFTTKSSGTGLGLVIARSLTRALGGELTLRGGTPSGTVAVLRFSNARSRKRE